MNIHGRFIVLSISLILSVQCAYALDDAKPISTLKMPAEETNLSFAKGTFEGWTVEGEKTWSIGINPTLYTYAGDLKRYIVNSLDKGENNVGVLRSVPFTIRTRLQKFAVTGSVGNADSSNIGNFVLLKSYPDGEVLRHTHIPDGIKLTPVRWETQKIIGRKVYLEVVDNSNGAQSSGFAWLAFTDYRQEETVIKQPVLRTDLYGLKIDEKAEDVYSRSLPFLAALPDNRGKTTRTVTATEEKIPVGVSASALYLLGMINEGWDNGVAHWAEHPELRTKRDDQVQIGSRIGEVEIRYTDGKFDRIPIVIGVTAWFVTQWVGWPSNGISTNLREPFASRPEYMAVMKKAFRIQENSEDGLAQDNRHTQYYLAVKPRTGVIASIIIHDNPELRGRPLLSAVTLACAQPSDKLLSFGSLTVDATDILPMVNSANPGNWSADIKALSKVLYTSDADIPKKVELIDFPKSLDASRIIFTGGIAGDMLSNIWVANMIQMEGKFSRDTGEFLETGKSMPWYGGYSGIGTWGPFGIYYGGAYGRSAEGFASLVIRGINDPVRTANFVDFCDKCLYFYRPNHDPDKGPWNSGLDLTKYPKDAPPHWSFGISVDGSMSLNLNEISGTEEMDGHGSVSVGRWIAWRLMGAPSGDWLMKPRGDVYGKSRWDATRDSADFICWFMDYTGRDVIWSEGESTGWGAGETLTRKNVINETDMVKIRENYANADMYEVYPNFACFTALRCSAQIAEVAGDSASAKKWLGYAERIRAGMLRLLKTGDRTNPMWRVSSFSIFSSLQDSLVQAWFSMYLDGLDPNRMDAEMTTVTRNTLKRQLSQPYGYAPVLGMGYGQGWITESALILDDMDSAGPLLANIAKYSYDKNMDYVDAKRGIDWRPNLWLIPEGTNIMPDGRWYRIGDLTNGANQGPAMHALEICAGVDDTDPKLVKIMPRVPKPLKGLQIQNFFTLVADGGGMVKARVGYKFERPGILSLTSDRPIPALAVRLGPFDQLTAERIVNTGKKPNGSTVRLDKSGTWNAKDAWWIWVENLRNVTELKLEFGLMPK